jgi:ABC-type transporter Mla subunit MlaD
MQLQQIVNDQENQLNNIKELSDNLNRTNIAINIEKDEISRQFEKANNTLIQYQELTRQMVPKLPQLLMKVNTYDNEQAMLNNYLQLDDCVETWSHDLQLETDLILSQYNK